MPAFSSCLLGVSIFVWCQNFEIMNAYALSALELVLTCVSFVLQIRLWDAATGECSVTLKGHKVTFIVTQERDHRCDLQCDLQGSSLQIKILSHFKCVIASLNAQCSAASFMIFQQPHHAFAVLVLAHLSGRC